MTWFRIYWTSTNTDFPENFTSLMIASYFEIELDGIDLNSKDGTYERSPLSWAAGTGFHAIVKHVLIKGSRVFWNGIVKLPFGKGS
jgi:hypothetical protein